MALDPDTRLRQGREHVATPIGGETAMMSIQRGAYYAVGGTAEQIWKMLEQPMTPRQIAERLQSEYEVEPEHCVRDVNRFLRELLDEGLVEECGA